MPFKDKERYNAWMRTYRQRYPERVAATKRKKYVVQYPFLKSWIGDFKVLVGCMKCGYDLHPAALDFHHRDPATKSFNISNANYDHSMNFILEEMDKCDIICSNCHRIEHAEERKREASVKETSEC